MGREEKAVFTNLCMIYDDEGNILVQDRVDPDWPGICFPGGHVEPGEAFTESVIREVREETGLTIEAPKLCGIKQFPTENDSRYVVFLYKTNRFSGELQDSEEGKVFWIPRRELERYHPAADFGEMVRVFEDDSLNEFYYYKNAGNWDLKLL